MEPEDFNRKTEQSSSKRSVLACLLLTRGPTLSTFRSMWRTLTLHSGLLWILRRNVFELFQVSTSFFYFFKSFPTSNCTQLRFARQKQPMALSAGVAKHVFQNGRQWRRRRRRRRRLLTCQLLLQPTTTTCNSPTSIRFKAGPRYFWLKRVSFVYNEECCIGFCFFNACYIFVFFESSLSLSLSQWSYSTKLLWFFWRFRHSSILWLILAQPFAICKNRFSLYFTNEFMNLLVQNSWFFCYIKNEPWNKT